MDIVNKHEFSSDRAITNPEDDLLDRTRFVTDLTNAICSWQGKDSLVVALRGEWGSGKTSLKNLTLNLVSGIEESSRPAVIEFCPWQWAAQEQITNALFKEISITIGRVGKDENDQKLSKLLKKYAKYLSTGELAADGLTKALPAIFSVLMSASALGILIDQTWAQDTQKFAVLVLGLIIGVLAWGKKILNYAISNTEKKLEQSKQSLAELGAELTEILSKRNTPILIVMDDLDRLTSEELRKVIQLVKANLDFPNIVFLLLYQRDIVEKMLDSPIRSGSEYLEKIVQVSFDVPKIESQRVHEILSKKLDKIIFSESSASHLFEQTYWTEVFDGSLKFYFENLRNVYRFTPTFSFYFSSLIGRRVLEINPVDLIALECMRMFEPEVYKKIANSKKLLTQALELRPYEQREQREQKFQEIKEEVQGIAELATKNRKDVVLRLILTLFPELRMAFSSHSTFRGEMSDYLKHMRVCHESNFDRYFHFKLSEDIASNSDLDELFSCASDAKTLTSYLIKLQERGLLSDTLWRCSQSVEQISADNYAECIKGLLDSGDYAALIDNSKWPTIHTRLKIVVRRVIEAILDQNSREELLTSCFHESTGLSLIGEILMDESPDRSGGQNERLLSQTGYQKLKKIFMSRLIESAENQPREFIQHPFIVDFLYYWKTLESVDSVRNWLSEQSKNPQQCTNLLKLFCVSSLKNSSSDRNQDLKYEFKLDDFSDFFDIENFAINLKKLKPEVIDEEIKRQIDAFDLARKKQKNISTKAQ